MTKRILIIFMLIVAATMLFITACNSSSVPGSNSGKMDSKYVGKYYARCQAAGGIGYQECAFEIGSTGKCSPIYDEMPQGTFTCKVENGKLLADDTGVGNFHEVGPISGDKLTIGKDVYVKKSDKQVADEKAAAQKKYQDEQHAAQQKEAEEKRQEEIQSKIDDLEYSEAMIQSKLTTYQMYMDQYDGCEENTPPDQWYNLCTPDPETMQWYKDPIAEYATEYTLVAAKYGAAFCREHGLPIGYNPDGTPIP